MASRTFVSELLTDLSRLLRGSFVRLMVDAPLTLAVWVTAGWTAARWLRPAHPGSDGFGLKLIASWVGAVLLASLAAACALAVLQWDADDPPPGLGRRLAVAIAVVVLISMAR
jgi:purine-cytosine permease-like protein